MNTALITLAVVVINRDLKLAGYDSLDAEQLEAMSAPDGAEGGNAFDVLEDVYNRVLCMDDSEARELVTLACVSETDFPPEEWASVAAEQNRVLESEQARRAPSATVRPNKREVTMARSRYDNRAEWAALIQLGRDTFGAHVSGIAGADKARVYYTANDGTGTLYSVRLTDAERAFFVF